MNRRSIIFALISIIFIMVGFLSELNSRFSVLKSKKYYHSGRLKGHLISVIYLIVDRKYNEHISIENYIQRNEDVWPYTAFGVIGRQILNEARDEVIVTDEKNLFVPLKNDSLVWEEARIIGKRTHKLLCTRFTQQGESKLTLLLIDGEFLFVPAYGDIADSIETNSVLEDISRIKNEPNLVEMIYVVIKLAKPKGEPAYLLYKKENDELTLIGEGLLYREWIIGGWKTYKFNSEKKIYTNKLLDVGQEETHMVIKDIFRIGNVSSQFNQTRWRFGKYYVSNGQVVYKLHGIKGNRQINIEGSIERTWTIDQKTYKYNVEEGIYKLVDFQ
ncbi:MAG: hypothetical protein GTO45_40560 [Candidatus Aminicenantes bacterium]|nr:hypothetical protein [Candidatus Aminicenantes bacterium]NIM84899.1 hypothetical protein [Candidatus Aminicenantes bacterium]NIN24410.1 hypothetical protein [Candidatus Aminicenantes bacterium]NIN48174.1 hypothetical protein [Candidatus Aminicenantes bacterium]NIN91077.1 hypothetical protein [Candidatus Aminicenantes bacterium]